MTLDEFIEWHNSVIPEEFRQSAVIFGDNDKSCDLVISYERKETEQEALERAAKEEANKQARKESDLEQLEELKRKYELT